MEQQCSRCGFDHSPGSPDCPAGRLGTVVAGRYRLESLLGVGGFGAVYRAVHVELGRAFALKLLVPPFARQPGVAERFVREARVAASLEHPGIVAVTDFGTSDGGDPYLVMELLRGETVQARLQQAGGRLRADETVAIAREALEALAAAHARNVVHRDLKPENLFLLDRPAAPRLKILDFGLAKALDRSNELTQSGEFIGTVNFASPEQLLDFRAADVRTDVYSLGATLYYLLTGTPPATGGSTTEVIARILRGDVERHPRERAPATPEWLDRLIARALAKEPGERFADGGAMLGELDRLATLANAGAFEAATEPGGAEATELIDRRDGIAGGSAREPTAAAGSRRPVARGRRVALGAASAVVLALVLWLAVRGRETGPPGDPGDAPTPLPERARLAAVELAIGSDAAEVERAWAWCRELAGDACRRDLYEREEPRHAVRLGAFEIDRDEVTNRDFASWLAEVAAVTIEGDRVRVEGESVADLHPEWSGLAAVDGRVVALAGREELPVVQVTWFGAERYCRAQGGRLPSEAEWERAARGVERREFPWGDARPDCERTIFGRGADGPCRAAGGGPVAAGGALGDVTPEGVRQLGGNVSEWVADVFVAPYPECPAPCEDPRVEGDGPRVVRGGNWEGLAEMTRAAGRGRRSPDEPSTQIGFRCAREAGEGSR